MRIPRTLWPGDHAMGGQPAIAPNQYNISFANLIRIDVVNQKRVARPDRGQHAPAGGHEAKAAKRSQNIDSKAVFRGGCSILQSADGVAHDTFVLSPQPLCVLVILPQESAEV